MEVGVASRAEFIHVTQAHGEQDQNAPHQVMDMAATHGDVLEGPDVMLDGSNQQADRQEGDKEADRCQEHSPVRPVREIGVQDQAQLGEMEQQQHGCCYQNNEDQQYPLA